MRSGEKDDPTIIGLKATFADLAKTCGERLDPSLFAVLTGTIQRKLNRITADADQSGFDYLQNLLPEILLVIEDVSADVNDKVEEVFWQYNFNSRPYFLYYIKRVSNKVQAEETLFGKLELLAYELKNVNQRFSERTICYTTAYSSLQDIVSNWLSEEIAFHRTKQQLTITFVHSEKPLNPGFKVALDLSVAQFSCLIRGMVEKKFILNTNLTELAGFLSNTVITKRSENISAGSFRKKYYNLEESTKKSVIDMLNKLIDWFLRN